MSRCPRLTRKQQCRQRSAVLGGDRQETGWRNDVVQAAKVPAQLICCFRVLQAADEGSGNRTVWGHLPGAWGSCLLDDVFLDGKRGFCGGGEAGALQEHGLGDGIFGSGLGSGRGPGLARGKAGRMRNQKKNRLKSRGPNSLGVCEDLVGSLAGFCVVGQPSRILDQCGLPGASKEPVRTVPTAQADGVIVESWTQARHRRIRAIARNPVNLSTAALVCRWRTLEAISQAGWMAMSTPIRRPSAGGCERWRGRRALRRGREGRRVARACST